MKRILFTFFISFIFVAFNQLLATEVTDGYVVKRGERPPVNLNSLTTSDYDAGKIYLKFKADYADLIASGFSLDENNRIKTGLTALDALNQQYLASNYRQLIQTVYNSGQKSHQYQERHKAWGFHLWFEVDLAEDANILEAVEAYQSNPAIELAEPIYKKVLYEMPDGSNENESLPQIKLNKSGSERYTPNDPLLGAQWHYNNTGANGGTAGKDISLFDAWDIEKGHSDVIVAIVDGGIQTDHEDLAGNMWSGVGYNFVDDNSTIVPHSHGTHVAGTVAAETNNTIGVAGVAGGSGSDDGVRLMSCQVFKAVEGGDQSGDFAAAMIYAADNDAAISQNSWGTSPAGAYNALVLDAIDYFNTNGGGSVLDGGITIFAAGNSNDDANYYPGYYSGVLVVAATNNKDERSYYSNYGDYIDISAPGGETNTVTAAGIGSTDLNNYTYKQGTSMACPHVSGVAALIVSYAHRNGVTLKNDDIFQILKETADDHYAENPTFTGKLGTGRLNAHAALLATNSYFSPTALTPDHYFDFDGTMQGWYSVATTGNKNFVWTNQGGYYGGQISSTSASNGYVMYDNLNVDATGPNPAAALLYSPVFDLSGATSLYFSFEHKARHLGQEWNPAVPNMSLKLEASNDGFATNIQELWSYDFPDTQHLIVEGNHSIDISALAGSPNIQFRFNYAGGAGYWWLIDDVYIAETSPVATTTLPYSESFDSDLGECAAYSVLGDTKNWHWFEYNGNGFAKMSGFNSGETEEDWLILPGINADDYTTITMNFETAYNFGTNGDDNYLKLFYSTDYSGAGDPSNANWTELAFTQPGVDGYVYVNSGDIDLSAISGQFYLGFKYRGTSENYRTWQIDNINIYQELITLYFRGPDWMDNIPHNPEIWGPFNGWSGAAAMTYDNALEWWKTTIQVADASAELTYQSRFAQSGTTKYQKAFENFGANPTFTTTTGEIWIDASDNASFSWSGNDFYLAQDKITETQPLISEPASHVTNLAISADSESQISLSWTDSDAAYYLIKGSTVGYADISDPVDGTAEADALLVKNIGSTIQSVSFSGLDAATTYYFKVFPYNGTGSTVNYKTDGTVPQESATTNSSPYYYAGMEGDGETKGSYGSGTVTISDIQWDLTEALIGTLATDYKTGIRSVRMRGYGTSAMTMLEDKAGGIGSIYFNYRRYGTDAQVDWKVEYSTDGGSNWTQIGSVFTAPDSDEVQTFHEKVNVDGNIRLRIKRETETGSSNRRLNIDDIIVTNYSTIGLLADISTFDGFDVNADALYASGTLFNPNWPEPGSNSDALFSRLGITDLFINIFNITDGTYSYKYFKNTTWSNGEWGAGPDRSRSLSAGDLAKDIVSYLIFTGNGNISSVANWQAADTPSEQNVIIYGDAIVDEAFSVLDLIIEDEASVTVQAGQQLTVSNTLTNNAGTAALFLQSDATGTASLLHNTADVDMTIQRYLTGDANTANAKYHTVSVPLTAASDPQTGLFMGAYLYRFDFDIQNYVSMGTSTTTPLEVDEGYLLYYPNDNITYDFAGQANNGSFAAAVDYGVGNHYNLVPNPYPSAIDWDAASGWTKDNMNAAIYIYNTASSGTGNIVWASYVAGSGGAGTNGGTNIIPAGQAFFVQSNAAAPVLSMTNEVRVHNSQAFFKNTTEETETLRLFAHSGDFTDEIVVRYLPESSINFDGQYDALKFKNWNAAPNIYSLTSDKTELSINSIPYSAETYVMEVGFERGEAGEVVIEVQGMESFGDWVTIFLEDLLTGARIDLREQNTYSFTHEVENEPLRFNLQFMGVTGTDELSPENDFRIWSANSMLYLSHFADAPALMEVFDLQGRLLFSEKLDGNSSTSVGELPFDQVLIVRLSSEHSVTNQKVIIR